jgi:hypothetical protein
MIPFLLAAALAAPTAVADMRWQNRVLLIAAPSADDPGVIGQRKALAGWDAEARDRDLAIVTVLGDRVTGATDSAAALRKRHRLPTGRFVAILIGKDGGEKMRSYKPIPADTLATVIDAMPMRRTGQR